MDITYYISTLQIIDLSSQYAFHVLHTPGHTPESVVYLLIDKTKGNKPLKVLAVHFKDIILYRWGGGGGRKLHTTRILFKSTINLYFCL